MGHHPGRVVITNPYPSQFVVLNCSHSIKLPMQATPHALSFSPAQTAAVTTPGVSGEQDGSMEELAQKHAAEVASLQAAFRARLAAAEEDLQVLTAIIAPACLSQLSKGDNGSFRNGQGSLVPECAQASTIKKDGKAIHPFSGNKNARIKVPATDQFKVCCPVQAKSEQILALEHALVSAEEALAARQEALGECQDMLAEMQGFSEAQRHRADQEHAQAQVGCLCYYGPPSSQAGDLRA